MKYKSFFMGNYKGVKDKLVYTPTENNNKPVCIIGNNESGKTTILKGIELIGQLCKKGEAFLQNGDRNKIMPKGDYFSGDVLLGAVITANTKKLKENEILEKYLKKSNGEFEIKITFTYSFDKASFKEMNEMIEFNGSVIAERADIEEIRKEICNQVQDVIYYDNFKFVVPEKIRFQFSNQSTHDDTLLNSPINKHWQSIFTDILKGVNPKKVGDFQTDVVDWYQNPEHNNDVADSRLRNMGKYIDEILAEWTDANNAIDKFEITKCSPENETDNVLSDYKLEVVGKNTSYKMDERSMGLQWSFCFHILTRIRKNRHNAGFIFLLDEPASNLHIRPQNRMLEHLQKLCDKDCAVVYSTHAPELIDTEMDCLENNTYIAKNKSDEYEDTNISLYKLTDTEEIDTQDIEPILANISYRDMKHMSDSQEITNDNTMWKRVGDTLSKITSVESLQKMSLVMKMVEFVDTFMRR